VGYVLAINGAAGARPRALHGGRATRPGASGRSPDSGRVLPRRVSGFPLTRHGGQGVHLTGRLGRGL